MLIQEIKQMTFYQWLKIPENLSEFEKHVMPLSPAGTYNKIRVPLFAYQKWSFKMMRSMCSFLPRLITEEAYNWTLMQIYLEIGVKLLRNEWKHLREEKNRLVDEKELEELKEFYGEETWNMLQSMI